MSDTLPKGTIIAKNRYRIMGVLGQGGFGVTYLAHHTSNGSKVAIKEYFPRKYATRDSKGRVVPVAQKKSIFVTGRDVFLEETEILRGLPKQRGLVGVYGALKKHNTAYCIMEHIDGLTLKELAPKQLARTGYIPEGMVRDLVISVGSALDAVHNKAKMAHRDIKPDNIMIRRQDMEPVLIDFGAARPLHRKVTLPSMYTRHYAALEQFQASKTRCGDAENIGPWTDVFSLSVVLYELVTQGLPPPADDRWAALQANGHDPYLPARENLKRNRVPAQYSEALLDLIDAGCALRPRNRPQTARQFAALMGPPTGGQGGGQTSEHTGEQWVVIPIEPTGPSLGGWAKTVWQRSKLPLIIAFLACCIAGFAFLSDKGYF